MILQKILNMTVDGLLNEEAWAKRQITYMDTGLDTRKLYELKNDVQKLVSDDKKNRVLLVCGCLPVPNGYLTDERSGVFLCYLHPRV